MSDPYPGFSLGGWLDPLSGTQTSPKIKYPLVSLLKKRVLKL